MEPKFVTVYQAGGSDGDRRSWNLGFYRDETTAGEVSSKNWGTTKKKTAIDVGGTLYLLESKDPIIFTEDAEAKKKAALNKLTAEDRAILGLKD